jgi:crotonobetainyl-CoA:carnitine CoA-transferase CaiB-like acyl-CoA transferase
VASVAAGVLAANGVLAAMIGHLRGRPVARVETSVLQAGVFLVAHHIAAATSGGELLASPAGPEPGPPFRTADGRWFEIEVFDAETWKSFWGRLGAGDAALGRAWTSFRARYYRGRCSLPRGLHEATARYPLAELAGIAQACGVSLCPVRTYPEVLLDPGWAGRGLTVVDPPVPSPAPGPESSLPPAGSAPVAAVGDGEGLPLHGIRVVEATSRMQGPLAALLLQMLGAEVIRVEPPGGDIGRMVPPLCGDTGSFFQCFNRGKQSVELDLTLPSGRAELLDLLAGADAFLHNWRPGKAGEWGLDQAGTAAANRRLVHAEASGWGEPSANSHLIGTDFLVQAYAGFGDGLNPVGDPPLTSRVLLTDCMGALVTCEGILSGLFMGAMTDRGVTVSTSLLEGAMATQAHVLEALSTPTGANPARPGGRPVWGPLDRPIAADGGSLVLSLEGDADLRRLCEVCGVEESRGSHRNTEQRVADSIATASPRHWAKLLGDAGILCAIVSSDLADVPGDPRLAPLFEPLSPTCRAPATPWVLTP